MTVPMVSSTVNLSSPSFPAPMEAVISYENYGSTERLTSQSPPRISPYNEDATVLKSPSPVTIVNAIEDPQFDVTPVYEICHEEEPRSVLRTRDIKSLEGNSDSPFCKPSSGVTETRSTPVSTPVSILQSKSALKFGVERILAAHSEDLQRAKERARFNHDATSLGNFRNPPFNTDLLRTFGSLGLPPTPSSSLSAFITGNHHRMSHDMSLLAGLGSEYFNERLRIPAIFHSHPFLPIETMLPKIPFGMLRNDGLGRGTGDLNLGPRGEPSLNSLEESSTQGETRRKRSWTRAVFSNLQRKGLEKRFALQKYITKPDRRQLAATLGLTDVQVKVWFQNRRMKWRHSEMRKMRSHESEEVNPCHSTARRMKTRPQLSHLQSLQELNQQVTSSQTCDNEFNQIDLENEFLSDTECSDIDPDA